MLNRLVWIVLGCVASGAALAVVALQPTPTSPAPPEAGLSSGLWIWESELAERAAVHQSLDRWHAQRFSGSLHFERTIVDKATGEAHRTDSGRVYAGPKGFIRVEIDSPEKGWSFVTVIRGNSAWMCAHGSRLVHGSPLPILVEPQDAAPELRQLIYSVRQAENWAAILLGEPPFSSNEQTMSGVQVKGDRATSTIMETSSSQGRPMSWRVEWNLVPEIGAFLPSKIEYPGSTGTRRYSEYKSAGPGCLLPSLIVDEFGGSTTRWRITDVKIAAPSDIDHINAFRIPGDRDPSDLSGGTRMVGAKWYDPAGKGTLHPVISQRGAVEGATESDANGAPD